jgi:hypothetical protein
MIIIYFIDKVEYDCYTPNIDPAFQPLSPGKGGDIYEKHP